jgi:hypothetical protein
MNGALIIETLAAVWTASIASRITWRVTYRWWNGTGK